MLVYGYKQKSRQEPHRSSRGFYIKVTVIRIQRLHHHLRIIAIRQIPNLIRAIAQRIKYQRTITDTLGCGQLNGSFQ